MRLGRPLLPAGDGGRLAGDAILAGDLESGGVAAGFGGDGFFATAAFAAATALVAGDVGGLEPLALVGLVATLRVAPTGRAGLGAATRPPRPRPPATRAPRPRPRPAAGGAAAVLGGRWRRGAALLALAALRAAAWASPRVAGGLGFVAAAAGSAGGTAATTSTSAGADHVGSAGAADAAGSAVATDAAVAAGGATAAAALPSPPEGSPSCSTISSLERKSRPAPVRARASCSAA